MEDQEETIILDLPLNTIVEIFKYLSAEDLAHSVRSTCKLWNELSFESVLWRTVDVSRMFPWSSFSNRSFLNLLAQVQDSVESLHVDINRLNLDVLYHEGIHCTNLKEICIEGEHSEKNSESDIFSCIRLVSEKYPSLKSLQLAESWIIFDNDLFSGNSADGDEDGQIEQRETIFPDLESLTIDRNEVNDDGSALLPFLKKHPRLKNVVIRNCIMSSDLVTFLCIDMSCLETLDLENSLAELLFEDNDTYEDVLKKIKLPNLKKLVLNHGTVDDRFLKHIVKEANGLEHLSLTGMECITNAGLEFVASYCPKLKQLHLAHEVSMGLQSNITDAGIERIVEKCCHLTVLNLNHVVELTDSVVQSIATYCPNLEELHVVNCISLTDKSICAIAENCKMLKLLDVSYCSKLTGKCFNGLIRLCKHLACVRANSCHRVSNLSLTKITEAKDISESNASVNDATSKGKTGTDRTFCLKVGKLLDENDSSEKLIVNMEQNHGASDIRYLEIHSHIRELELSFCVNLSNLCMKQIATFCKDLRILNIQACSLVTNAGIKEVIKGCKFLNKLNISGGSISRASRLNDSCLEDIAAFGQNLEILSICQNNNITAESVFQVVKHCPKISVIFVDNRKALSHYNQALIQRAGEVEEKTISLQFHALEVEIRIYKNKEIECRCCQ